MQLSPEGLRDRIINKFGSVQELANRMGTSAANINQRIPRATPKFLYLLECLGVELNDEPDKKESQMAVIKYLTDQMENLIIGKTLLEKELEEAKAELEKLRREGKA